MKRIIKLKESDLEKIVKRILQEQDDWWNRPASARREYEKATSFLDRISGTKKTGKPNINPKNLKLGDGGNKDPKKAEDVKILQQKLMDAGFLKLTTGKPTGYFGDLTQKALNRYYGETTVVSAKGKTTPKDKGGIFKGLTGTKDNLTKASGSGFILVWAYPEYEPKIDGKGKTAQILGQIVRIASGGGSEGTYGKLGHGGCVVIEPNGNCISYEFGRYPGASEGYGVVLTDQLGKIAKIENGNLLNARQIAARARALSYPPGPKMKMKVAVVKLPNPNKAKQYASVKQREYLAADFIIGDAANCGTFARDVADAGGVDVDNFCFPNPTSVVNSFDDNAIEIFDI